MLISSATQANPVTQANQASTASTASNSLDTAINPNGQLNSNSFLQLLVSEMQNQDPLQSSSGGSSGTSGTQFITQLAMFSMLQQMTSMAQTDQSILNSQSISSGAEMLGKQVTLNDGNGGNVSGVVSAVALNNGSAEVTVNNQAYPVSDITNISQ
ncbi:flagellar hook capping protein [Alicyclobacillaceae bacterium I2511]|nr:flagellar hook capping protein [Alicyclobacillaceae bacterium I2511]